MTAVSGEHDGSRGRSAVVLVAQREVRTRLRSRVFTVGTAAMVVLVAIGILGATAIGRRSAATKVGFAGSSQALAPLVEASATASGARVEVGEITDAAAGEQRVRDGSLDALVTGLPTGPQVLVKADLAPAVRSALDAAVRQQVLTADLHAAGVDPALVVAHMAGAHVTVRSLEPGAPGQTENLVAALAVGVLLYIALGLYSGFVAQAVVEEKATRMVEIVLATVHPTDLLAGKIAGVGLVGVLQLTIVGLATLLLADLTHAVTIPALGAGAIAGDLVWFVLGFYQYAVAVATAASRVSRHEEVQGVIAPMMILLVLGYLTVFIVLPNPTSALSAALSMLPPFALVLMPVRMATGAAPLWQVCLAFALTVATAGALTWLAGRVYANSILRFGGRIRLIDALSRH
jgi:ABC-2 type transport system permease protein